MNTKAYIALCKDNEIVKKSSSGGAFTVLTDIKLQEGFKIYGCIMDEDLKTYHISSTDESGRNLMRGSKYIQSNINNSYKNIENDLKGKYKVVFSGTPCQVVGLYTYLKFKNIPINNLYTIEIICHGVGSNKFFYDYIENLEKKYKSKAVLCNFRTKSKPGKLQDMTIIFKNGKRYHSSTTRYDWFYSAYHKNLILRPSCYTCKFACKERYADITIADAWGKNEKISNSLIICNSKKGNDWMNSIKDMMKIEEIDFNELNIMNMQQPTKKPLDYNEFTKIYIEEGYLESQKYIGNNRLKTKVKVLCINIIDFLNLEQLIKKFKKR